MKSKFKVIIVLILCIFMFILVLYKRESYNDNNVITSENKNINILMINSYHKGHYWEGYVLEGLKYELHKYKNYNINLNIEYLDFRRYNKNEDKKAFKKELESKYANSSINIYIITKI